MKFKCLGDQSVRIEISFPEFKYQETWIFDKNTGELPNFDKQIKAYIADHIEKTLKVYILTKDNS